MKDAPVPSPYHRPTKESSRSPILRLLHIILRKVSRIEYVIKKMESEKVCEFCNGTGEVVILSDATGNHDLVNLGETQKCVCQEKIDFEE